MSKGHTIPLLHLAKLIHHHRPSATFMIFTTTGNHAFISDSLSSSIPPNLLNIISFPFPSHPAIPAGVESTDKFPSMSLLIPFVDAVERLQPLFESALEKLQIHATTCFLISDGFLYWTQECASKFNIPTLTFYGMSTYAQGICRVVGENRTLFGANGEDELIQVPDFPWIKVTKNDFERVFLDEPKGAHFEFVAKCGIATDKSYAILVNSLYEIESKFLEYWNSKYQPKAWLIGPLCLAEKPIPKTTKKPAWMEWLDRKRVEGKPVLYVAFGSQAEISDEQLKEIVIGLEKSEVDFLWALRIKPEQEDHVMQGFEEKVKGRGLVVKGWIGQREVLEHGSVRGFLSHCGWNSVIESICAGVPILAWPMMAEQHLNARMVTEEIKVGLRVETCNGSVRGFVKWEGLAKMVKELMGGEMGEVVRPRVKELSEAAKKAIQQGGTSWCNLELLLSKLETEPTVNYNNNGTVSNKNGSSPISIISKGVEKKL